MDYTIHNLILVMMLIMGITMIGTGMLTLNGIIADMEENGSQPMEVKDYINNHNGLYISNTELEYLNIMFGVLLNCVIQISIGIGITLTSLLFLCVSFIIAIQNKLKRRNRWTY